MFIWGTWVINQSINLEKFCWTEWKFKKWLSAWSLLVHHSVKSSYEEYQEQRGPKKGLVKERLASALGGAEKGLPAMRGWAAMRGGDRWRGGHYRLWGLSHTSPCCQLVGKEQQQKWLEHGFIFFGLVCPRTEEQVYSEKVKTIPGGIWESPQMLSEIFESELQTFW